MLAEVCMNSGMNLEGTIQNIVSSMNTVSEESTC